jgi:hypothetical protein
VIANRDIRDVVPTLGTIRFERCHAAVPVHQWKVSGEYKQCSNYGVYTGYCRIHRDIEREHSEPLGRFGLVWSWLKKRLRI